MEQEVIVSKVGRVSKAVIVKSRHSREVLLHKYLAWTFFFLKCYSILSVWKKRNIFFTNNSKILLTILE